MMAGRASSSRGQVPSPHAGGEWKTTGFLIRFLPRPQVPITALREIKILSALRKKHPNILHLEEMVTKSGEISARRS
jgi:hypothetical protein